MRLFRYSDWLTRKSILKLANWILADLRHMRSLKRRSIWNIKKASQLFRIDNQGTFCPNYIIIRQIYIPYGYGPVFVWFAKKSAFLVRTIFCTHQNFCMRNETSKIPSTSFGGCKNFVRRENPFSLTYIRHWVTKFRNIWITKRTELYDLPPF